MSQAGYFPRRSIAMDDALLGRAHHQGLGGAQGGAGGSLVACLDRFLDPLHEGAHLGAAVTVDGGAARDLAGRLFRRSGIGHRSSSLHGRLRMSRARVIDLEIIEPVRTNRPAAHRRGLIADGMCSVNARHAFETKRTMKARSGFSESISKRIATAQHTMTISGRMSLVPTRLASREPICAPVSEAAPMTSPTGQTTSPAA